MKLLGSFLLVMLVAFGSLARMGLVYGTLSQAHISETIGWVLLAFFAFLAAVRWAEHNPISMKWIIGVAILFRALLLFTSPNLSTDVYRYMWDGYVITEGVSPYAYAIDSPMLDYLDNPIRASANNTGMASPYMPAAQLVLAGLAIAFPLEPIFMQATMIIFDLLTGWVLYKLLTLAGNPPHRLILYLWNPIVIVEVAHGAHIDAWMILLTMLAIYATAALNKKSADPEIPRKPSFSHFIPPLFLALATLTKIMPVLIFPVLYWRWTWKQRFSYFVICVAVLLPFGLQSGWGLTGDLTGTGLFGALRLYAAKWQFNSGLFHWFTAGFEAAGFNSPLTAAKGLAAGIMIIILVLVWFWARNTTSLRTHLRLMAIPFVGYILMTPTVHPWYALILLAFLPFLPPVEGENRWLWWAVVPWMYLSGVLIFSYLIYFNQAQPMILEWIRRIQWVPTFWLTVIFVVLGFRKFNSLSLEPDKNIRPSLPKY